MNVLSLFDGISCGQIALNRLGIKYDNYYASEIDKHAVKVTLTNYPNTIQLGDVTKIKSETLPKISLLLGGSPCQSFSIAGKGEGFDGASKLFWEYVRIKNETQPTYFLFENVKGLTVGKHKKFLDEIIHELQALNYEVHMPWQVLNAKNFGVPQSRERLFLMGAKKGLQLPKYPAELKENLSTGSRVIVPFGRKKYYTAIVIFTHNHAPADY